MKCTTVLHGGVCHRTSTPHKSGNKMWMRRRSHSNCNGLSVHKISWDMHCNFQAIPISPYLYSVIPVFTFCRLLLMGKSCAPWHPCIYTTVGDARVCVFAELDQFLPVRSHFDTKRPVNFLHIATFPSPTFGPLFAFHCPLFFTKNNNLHAAMFWKVTVTTQDRPLNRKHLQPPTRVVQWESARLRS